MFGDYRWILTRKGNLTSSEQQDMLAALQQSVRAALAAQATKPSHFVRAELDPATILPPDSRLAREAEEICRELSPALANHSLRSWLFARALADIDGVTPDPEALYIAALLHDVGLTAPVPDECFTLRGAETARAVADRTGAAIEKRDTIADAICLHVSPGLTIEEHGVVAVYLAAGTSADVTGMRLWDLSQTTIANVVAAYPRQDFKADIARRWQAETDAVPEGRAALLTNKAGIISAIHRAPFAE